MKTPNVHFLMRVWCEGKKPCFELDFIIFFEPELILDLETNRRPIEDWWEESMSENIHYDCRCFFPERFELCSEPVLLEVIGYYCASGWQCPDGEYDEDFEFEVRSWAAAIEEEDTEENEVTVLSLLSFEGGKSGKN